MRILSKNECLQLSAGARPRASTISEEVSGVILCAMIGAIFSNVAFNVNFWGTMLGGFVGAMIIPAVISSDWVSRTSNQSGITT